MGTVPIQQPRKEKEKEKIEQKKKKSERNLFVQVPISTFSSSFLIYLHIKGSGVTLLWPNYTTFYL